MKKILIVTWLLCLLLLPTVTYSCRCFGSGDPPAAFNSAKAVFIGQMLSGSEKIGKNVIKIAEHRFENGKISPLLKMALLYGEAGNVRFAVKKVFKGNIKDEVVVNISSDTNFGVGCGFHHLLRGGRYLVYAYGKDEKSLSSGVCTRTVLIDNNAVAQGEDLKFLERLPQKGSGGNIRGNITTTWTTGQKSPFSNRIKINIVDANELVLTVKPDKHGKFQAKKIKPGIYRVVPELPKNYTLNLDKEANQFAIVIVDDLGTADANFDIYVDSKVSGYITDKKGRSLFSKPVSIRLTTQDANIISGFIAENGGHFEIPGVPPGQYILSFDTLKVGNDVVQQFYYPGTFDSKKAAPIQVHFGEKIESINFILPDEFKAGTDTVIYNAPLINATRCAKCRMLSRQGVPFSVR